MPTDVVAERSGHDHGGHCVLLVEDDEDTATIYHDILSHYGHDVHVAEDGHQALGFFDTVTPDLLIVDIALPGKIDGWAVIEFVNELDSPPPCIVTTALAGEEPREKAERLGCRLFMRKPIEPRQLLRAVDETGKGGSS